MLFIYDYFLQLYFFSLHLTSKIEMINMNDIKIYCVVIKVNSSIHYNLYKAEIHFNIIVVYLQNQGFPQGC